VRKPSDMKPNLVDRTCEAAQMIVQLLKATQHYYWSTAMAIFL